MKLIRPNLQRRQRAASSVVIADATKVLEDEKPPVVSNPKKSKKS